MQNRDVVPNSLSEKCDYSLDDLPQRTETFRTRINDHQKPGIRDLYIEKSSIKSHIPSPLQVMNDVQVRGGGSPVMCKFIRPDLFSF